MSSSKILCGGNGSIMSSLMSILPEIIIIFVTGIILYVIYLFFKMVLTPVKPDKQYTKVITIKNKRVKTNVHNYNEYKEIGGMTYVYPKSYNTYEYYVDGTDRNVYSISKFNYERINENDTIEVDIDEFNSNPILHIRKILKFEEPKKVFGIF